MAALILQNNNSMENKNFPKKFKAYLPFLLLLVLMVFLMPRSSRFNYDYRKGEPWAYETLVAQFDFPILKTDQQLMLEYEKIGSTLIPYYRHDPSVLVKAQSRLYGTDMGGFSDSL